MLIKHKCVSFHTFTCQMASGQLDSVGCSAHTVLQQKTINAQFSKELCIAQCSVQCRRQCRDGWNCGAVSAIALITRGSFRRNVEEMYANQKQ